MSNPKDVRASLGLLKNVLTTAFCACLFGIVFLSAGVAQAPGYGHGPDQWAPYGGGRYFDQLQKIVQTYRFSSGKVAY
jgi:hypothetical protein